MRKLLIDDIDYDKGLKLSEDEKKSFTLGASIGIPLNSLKSYLASPPDQQKQLDANAPGIPADTSVLVATNELASWIKSARNSNPKLRICIKADGEASYPSVSKIIKTLEGWKIFKFNLITNLKGIPPGTAAYIEANSGAAKKE